MSWRTNNVGEKTLRLSTLVFLVGYTPGIVLGLAKVLSKTLPHDAFGWVGTGMMAAWPVAHFLGYYRRKRICAASAALLHCIFAGLIFDAGCDTLPHSPWKHFSLVRAMLLLVYGGWHLSMGYLLVRLRVTKKIAAVYVYFLVLAIWMGGLGYIGGLG